LHGASIPIIPFTYIVHREPHLRARKLSGVARRRPEEPRQLDERNRVTLPPNVTEALGLRPGDWVKVELSGERAVIRKVRFVED
jgi:anaerobic selenocysteine-containing dehydrogenase